MSDFLFLGSTFDFLWRVCCFQERVQQLKENATLRLSSSMSRLELSFSPKWMSQNGTTIPIGKFLEEIFGFLHQILARGNDISIDHTQVTVIIHSDPRAAD